MSLLDPNKIRKARMSDVQGIYGLIQDAKDELVPRSYSDLMQNFDRFLIYEHKGKIIGVISFKVLPSLELDEQDKTLEIVSFTVSKRYRRKGIGTLLLHKMLKELEEYQPERILVLTFYPEFFKKFGFRKTSKRKLHSKIYLGCFNCTRFRSPLICPEVAMVRKLKLKKEGKRYESKKNIPSHLDNDLFSEFKHFS